MKSIRYIITSCVTLALVTTALAQEIRSNAEDSFITKPNGNGKVDLGATINLDSKGYPMLESFETIYDEMDYQGAVSAYLQAMPQMALFGSAKTNYYYGATGIPPLMGCLRQIGWSPIYLISLIWLSRGRWSLNIQQE